MPKDGNMVQTGNCWNLVLEYTTVKKCKLPSILSAFPRRPAFSCLFSRAFLLTLRDYSGSMITLGIRLNLSPQHRHLLRNTRFLTYVSINSSRSWHSCPYYAYHYWRGMLFTTLITTEHCRFLDSNLRLKWNLKKQVWWTKSRLLDFPGEFFSPSVFVSTIQVHCRLDWLTLSSRPQTQLTVWPLSMSFATILIVGIWCVLANDRFQNFMMIKKLTWLLLRLPSTWSVLNYHLIYYHLVTGHSCAWIV